MQVVFRNSHSNDVGRGLLSPSSDRLPNETTKADKSVHMCKCMFNINFPDFNVIYIFEREKTKTSLVLLPLNKRCVSCRNAEKFL